VVLILEIRFKIINLYFSRRPKGKEKAWDKSKLQAIQRVNTFDSVTAGEAALQPRHSYNFF